MKYNLDILVFLFDGWSREITTPVPLFILFFFHILVFIFSSHLVCECLVCVCEPMSGRRVNAGDISQDRLENDLLNNTLGTHRDPLH